ncbi:PadR family transcriptional regulator [Paenibacillus sp. NPDC056579]|uniref:PadR family transcriptional regulator n=1 Tax=unclassified Paenibacillus TaxID=185978 RepID=UPI001EF76456|nr:PadR family transcriptional regulator [Paenibacillus sp. H1-7]ULL13712.1 PadR family transcriptional regulator [Paenibacillus sp. H1-7]
MSLRYALLGLLAKKSSTGYELHQQFKEKLVYFWNVHHTQIYRELNKMEKDELVTSETIQQETHPDKKIYTLTPGGTKDLIHWLMQSSIPSAHIKDEFLVRVAGFPLISADEAIRLLEQVKRREQRHYDMTRKWREAHFPKEGPPPYELIGEYMTSEYGLIYSRSYIEWCDWAISVMETIRAKG